MRTLIPLWGTKDEAKPTHTFEITRIGGVLMRVVAIAGLTPEEREILGFFNPRSAQFSIGIAPSEARSTLEDAKIIRWVGILYGESHYALTELGRSLEASE